MNDTVLFVTTARSYRNHDFIVAANALGLEWYVITDAPLQDVPAMQQWVGDWHDAVALQAAVQTVQARARIVAVHALDDSGAFVAQAIAEKIAVPHNQAEAVLASRNKWVMRQALARASVPVPPFWRFLTHEDVHMVAARVPYPCVIKPTELNGSRGVIRANTPAEFVQAQGRVRALLGRIYPAAQVAHEYLVEGYIPGVEVALEGVMDAGELRVLALFDKPDPLEGPYFEETIYVTPSRLPAQMQTQISAVAQAAALALGLYVGPVHAELRITPDAEVFVVEVAGRSIGGLCSRTLQFGSNESLEMLILRQSAGMLQHIPPATHAAGGVMMIPIPRAGVLQHIHGLDAAQQVPGITAIDITSPLHQPIEPLPDGESYLGFIFADGDTPATVEAALRAAHACLKIDITPHIRLA
jgi:biotin carboxylase